MNSHFGKYELKSLLGKGTSGSVYRAVDTFSNDEVALKVIDPAVFQDPEFGTVLRKQFLKEASLAGKLHHPHIASILDAVVTEDAGYIVMEYVPGENLSRYAGAANLLSMEDAIQVAFKCCGALDYAFRQGIIQGYQAREYVERRHRTLRSPILAPHFFAASRRDPTRQHRVARLYHRSNHGETLTHNTCIAWEWYYTSC